jgi:adenine-specific DNA-methyltransferase
MDKWSFVSKELQDILNKIYSQEDNFELITKKIFKGSSTGNDKIFLLDLITKKDKISTVFSSALNSNIELENSLLYPFVYGKDIRRIIFQKVKN